MGNQISPTFLQVNSSRELRLWSDCADAQIDMNLSLYAHADLYLKLDTSTNKRFTYIFDHHVITVCYLLVQFFDISKPRYDSCGTSVCLLTVKHELWPWLWRGVMSRCHVALCLTSISICGRCLRSRRAGRGIVRCVLWIFSKIFFTFILFASEKWHFDI